MSSKSNVLFLALLLLLNVALLIFRLDDSEIKETVQWSDSAAFFILPQFFHNLICGMLGSKVTKLRRSMVTIMCKRPGDSSVADILLLFLIVCLGFNLYVCFIFFLSQVL